MQNIHNFIHSDRHIRSHRHSFIHRTLKRATVLWLLSVSMHNGFSATPISINAKAVTKPTDIGSQQRFNELPIAAPEQNPLSSEPKTAATSTTTNNTMDVDAKFLLSQPTLLQQAMLSVIAEQNMAGIQEILPIYIQWSQHDAETALLAEAMLARYQHQPKIAIANFSQLLRTYPQNDMLRWQLTLSLVENRQFKEAQHHLEQLQGSQQIPPVLIANYRQWIDKQADIQWQLAATIVQDNNINKAPDDKHYGRWTFDDPVDDKALVYSLQLGKQWQHRGGLFNQLQASYTAKNYHEQTQYNDHSLRVSAGIGWADAKQQYQLAPIWAYRLYGNRPYSRSVGLRINSRHQLSDNDYLYSAAEVGRVHHHEDKRQFLNNRNYLASTTWLHQLDDNQSISAGIDYYRQYKTRDTDDSYQQKGLRLGGQKNWQQGQGLGTQLGASYAVRDYEGASFFSNGQKRNDKEYAINASIWHEKLNFANVLFPKLTFSHQRLDSNDASKSYALNNIGAELEMRF